MAVWVLDPFGGGSESGYIGKSGIKESDIALEAVLEAKRHLERNGEKVFLTRSDNSYLSKENRQDIINQYNTDVLVIFRMSSNSNGNISGVKVAHINYDKDEEYLAQLIKSEIQSELKTENADIVNEVSLYNKTNCKTIIVYGEYLSNEKAMENFTGKIYGHSVAKACLAYKDKVLIERAKSEPKKMQNRAYRVCVGYYKDYDSAMNKVLKLNKEGISDAYVVPYDGR